MSAHMEYYSEQLKNFDLAGSDEEIVDNLPEMQCLPDEMVKAFGSTERSLLDALEKLSQKRKGSFKRGLQNGVRCCPSGQTQGGTGMSTLWIKPKRIRRRKT
ncbi:hypothetical protein D1007_04324 [Hordeum vulgare]|nr:hypothetical protein D1007_04324 [Hordeum vulgare]